MVVVSGPKERIFTTGDDSEYKFFAQVLSLAVFHPIFMDSRSDTSLTIRYETQYYNNFLREVQRVEESDDNTGYLNWRNVFRPKSIDNFKEARTEIYNLIVKMRGDTSYGSGEWVKVHQLAQEVVDVRTQNMPGWPHASGAAIIPQTEVLRWFEQVRDLCNSEPSSCSVM